jgi:hypothetical protein
MSVDGPGLFADDHAFDVRALYREFVAEGKTGPEATDLLIKEWEGLLDDSDIGPAFWLALGATQWKLGRLEPRVLEKALQIIDEGSDLERWTHNPTQLRKRKSVLQRLRKQLISAQPTAQKIKPRDRVECDWEVGEVLVYKLKSGKRVLLRVTGFLNDLSGKHPVFELLDWIGENVLTVSEIGGLTKRPGALYPPPPDGQTPYRRESRFFLHALKPRSPYHKQLERLGIKLKCKEASLPCVLFFWRALDESLAQNFGIKV